MSREIADKIFKDWIKPVEFQSGPQPFKQDTITKYGLKIRGMVCWPATTFVYIEEYDCLVDEADLS